MRKVFRIAIIVNYLILRSSYGTAASPGGYPTQVTAVYILQNLLYLRKVKVINQAFWTKAGLHCAPLIMLHLTLIERGQHPLKCQLSGLFVFCIL